MIGKGETQSGTVVEFLNGTGNGLLHLIHGQSGPFQKIEIIGGMKPARSGECSADLDGVIIVTIHLAHQEATFIFISNSADSFAELLDRWLIQLRRIMQLTEKWLLVLRQWAKSKIRIWRIVTIGRCISIDGMHRIQTEPVYAAVKPETGDLHQCLAHGRIGVVQVWLAGQEVMQIILLALRFPAPCTPTKKRQPVRGRRPVW